TMSHNMQVLSITHLPQVAAKADNHYRVYKEDKNSAAQTHLQQLGHEQRLVEIAQMMGGKTYTDTTLANARELLN
ncbi:MAG: DNA repair protein RecN, partial [Marinirhabdus sp.]